jgi:hypothetical protein
MRSRLRKIASEAARVQSNEYAENEELSRRCRQLLAELRKRCPDLVPKKPIRPGQPGATIPLDIKTAMTLFHEAMRPLRGPNLLWRSGDNELIVRTDKVKVHFDDGVVLVSIPVSCDQAKRATVHVPFATGNSERNAGLVVATESVPRGPARIVSIWGEALTAFAWKSFLQVVATLAEESGTDLDGQGLIPFALSVNKESLSVQTLARHEFDRTSPRRLSGQIITRTRGSK